MAKYEDKREERSRLLAVHLRKKKYGFRVLVSCGGNLIKGKFSLKFLIYDFYSKSVLNLFSFTFMT